jgi:two-component system cell cycle sensor histidine kinase/response regulator CckA
MPDPFAPGTPQFAAVLHATRAGRGTFYPVDNTLVLDERGREILGLPDTQLAAAYDAWIAIVHEGDRARLEREVADNLTSGDEINLRYRIRHPDGTVRHIWSVGSITRDARGVAVAATGLVFDETDLRRGESALGLQSEILKHIGEGVCLSHAYTGFIVYANPGLERMLYVAPGAAVGMHVGRLLTRADPTALETIEQSIRGTGSWLGEMPHTRPDGSTFWTAVSVTSFEHAEHGRAWVWILQDLGRPRERESARVHSHTELTTIYDSIADAVFSVRMPSREIEYANEAVRQMFGYRPDEIIGRQTLAFYPSESAYVAYGARLHQAFLAGERQVRAEMELARKDGSRFWAGILTTFVTEQGALSQVISVIRDRTKEKDLENQLIQAQKMEALGTLAGGIAHDMNNVLAAVLTLSTVLQDELPPPDPRRADIEKIIESAERGRSLVQNLLSMARKTPTALKPVDVDREIDRILSVLSHTLPKEIELTAALGAPGVLVHGDPALLSQTILNICLNSKDAISNAGQIRVESAVVALETGQLLAGLSPGPYYRLEVVDDGAGMSPDVRTKAFDPFFTTKDTGHGTGLGLSMAYNVVAHHGGAIDLWSQPGKGTRVTCWLPVVDAPRPEENAPATPVPVGRQRVLVVDDEEMVREVARRALERLGHEVVVADGGATAIELVSQAAVPFDIVLLDVAMPRMNGAACFERLRELRPDLPVLFSTGHEDLGMTGISTEARVGMLKKPYSLARLREAVEGLVRR